MSKIVNTAAIDAAEKGAVKSLNHAAKSSAESFSAVVQLALAAGKDEGQYQTSCEAVNRQLSPLAKKSFKAYKSTILWCLKNAPTKLVATASYGDLRKLRKDTLAAADTTTAPIATNVQGLVIDGKAITGEDLSPEVVTFAKDLQALLNNLSSNEERAELLTHAKSAISIWLKRHLEEKNEETKAKIKIKQAN